MKCNWCSYKTVSRSSMVDHVKNNHREKVVSKIALSDSSSTPITDSLILSTITNSFSSFATDSPSFSGGGGSFDGGGSSSSYDSGSSCSSDSGSCGGCD